MTYDISEIFEEEDFKRDLLLISILMTTVGILGFYGAYEDWVEGVSYQHIVLDIVINIVQLTSGAYLFLRIVHSKKEYIKKARIQYLEAKASATEYKQLVDSLRNGIAVAVTAQFKIWELTPAEEEICLFILKGFSLQEIAKLRNTSERTIRQQASTMYKKTGLPGRAQLSAFFLEDVLGDV